LKRLFVLACVVLSACVRSSAPQEALPTAYIDPSYPTVQSAPVANIQTTSGIEVRADSASRNGKQVDVNVCFTLLDASDWSVWGATLQYPGGAVVDFSSTLVSLQEPLEGQSGLRCDTLSFFNIPPDADLSTVTITIDAIAAAPRAQDYCAIYMSKIQQVLNERGIAIQLTCVDSAGMQVMQIVSKPDTMSQEEAERIVFSDEFYTVKGPWSFIFNLGQ
jgi:transcriptional regulator GlxA family with amidase domain